MKNTNIRQEKNKGFTLIEMVVVMTIFSIAITIVTEIFIQGQRSQRKTAALQKLQTDLRSSTNKIAGDVRTGTIDYAYYSTPPSTTALDAIAIKDFEGKSVIYKMSSTTDSICTAPTANASQSFCPDAAQQCLIMSIDGQCAPLTSSDVTLDSFMVFITPGKDTDSEQSFVRLNIGASSIVKGASEPTVLSLQTSVSSRQYRK